MPPARTSGVTDRVVQFAYEQGQAITFSVGRVTVGTVPMAKTLVTPVDLVGQGSGTSIRVLNVVRFLMMLDEDRNREQWHSDFPSCDG